MRDIDDVVLLVAERMEQFPKMSNKDWGTYLQEYLGYTKPTTEEIIKEARDLS